jgi:hypothetical protein
MIDTRNKRAAAIGFGLASLLVLPAAEGALSVESAGHALSAYRYDLADVVILAPQGDVIVLPADFETLVLPPARTTILLPADPSVFLLPIRRAP